MYNAVYTGTFVILKLASCIVSKIETFQSCQKNIWRHIFSPVCVVVVFAEIFDESVEFVCGLSVHRCALSACSSLHSSSKPISKTFK